MKKILITAMACLWAAMAFANHWTPNTNFESSMTITAVVQINGVEQNSENLELGVFCGDECRGSQQPIYIQVLNRYVYFTQVYGLPTDVFLFKLFDHSQGVELELVSPAALAFNENGYGSLSNPHILNFTSTVVIHYTVTANPDPVEGGLIEGAGTYANAQTCSLVATAHEGYAFLNWTENGNVVSTSENYSFAVIANRNLVAHFVPSGSHWLVNDNYEFDMTLTGVVQINGVDQRSETLELGVFCGNECRGSQRPRYIAAIDRYVFFTQVYGLQSDAFTFKLYDHGSGAVLDLVSPAALSFNAGGYGSLARPKVLDFTGSVFQIEVEANYADGGTVSGAGLYNQGATATLTATPNEGYAFVNWMKDGVVVSTNPSITFTVDASATYQVNYKLWYSVNVTANPTAGGTVRGGGNYEQGQSCTLRATANTGYTFVNWTKNGEVVSDEANYTFNVNETATYVANFSLNGYEVMTVSSPIEGGAVTGAGTYSHGTTATLTATANEGYTFANWTRNGSVVSYNARYSFTVTGAATYVANFTLNSYQVTAVADPADGNTVTGSGTYNHGDTVVLNAVAMGGYAFRNWTENGNVVSTSESYSFVVVANRALVAHFVASENHWFVNDDYEFDMTVTGVVLINGVEQRSSDIELGVFCGGECRGAQKPTYIAVLDRYVYFTQVYGMPSDSFTFKLYDHVQDVEFALASPEAILFDVNGYGTLSNPQVLDFSGAVFQIDVEANIPEGGTVSGAGLYNQGAIATLTAVASTGYTFQYWGLDGDTVSTLDEYTFEVSGTAEFVAHFGLKNYPVTTVSSPVYGGTVEGTGTYDHFSTCTLTAIAEERFIFHAWEVEGVMVSTEATYRFEVDGPKSLTAVFFYYQEEDIPQGWTWWSTPVELDSIDGLAMLEESLGDKGVIIKGANQFVQNHSSDSLGWMGNLTTLTNEQGYKVQTTAACRVTMTGPVTSPIDHPITIQPGWNWIGYPVGQAQSVSSAMSGFEPSANDIIKSQGDYSNYIEGFGWLPEITLEPGRSYLYYSNNSTNQTLVFAGSGGSSHPVSYTAVDYIWCDPVSGTHPSDATKIETGVKLNNVSKVRCKMKPMASNGWVWLGNVNDSDWNWDSQDFRVFSTSLSSNNAYMYFDYKSSRNYGSNSYFRTDTEVDITIEITSSYAYLYLTDTGSTSNYFFRNTIDGSLSDVDFLALLNCIKLGVLQIWDADGVLVKDLKAVLDGDNTPCMYDEVNHEYIHASGVERTLYYE